MQQLLIQVLKQDLVQASLILALQENFNPETCEAHADQFPEVPGSRYRDLYHQAVSRLQKIRLHVPLDVALSSDTMEAPEEPELERINNQLGEVWQQCSDHEEHLHKLNDEEQMLNQLEQALENFSALNIDLSLLQGQRLFLDLHVGLLPSDHVPQLREAIALAGYLMFVYMESGDNTHVIIIGPKGEREQELAAVLNTAGFHHLEIPVALRDRPEKVQQNLQAHRQRMAAERESAIEKMRRYRGTHNQALIRAQEQLMMAEPFVNMEASVRSRGELAILFGWAPAREVGRIEKALSEQLRNPFHINAMTPPRSLYSKVPTCLPVNWFTESFTKLVQQYGIPRYGEINPTLVFALSFIAMFGMMFGDIGHGAVIMLAAWVGRKKLKRFTPFVVSAGVATLFFGMLYGSLFGYEDLFHALWLSPLSDPLYMLRMALLWGIGFMLVISLLSIHNRLVSGQLDHALFDTNGVVSIVLYLSIISGLYRYSQVGQFGISSIVLAILALVTLLAFKLIKTHATFGERLLVATVETFETVTGYISNTLSFLRVAAFSLNHVALAIAVFALAETMDTTGHWLTVVLGNLFILVLEGAIVTIQTLRLEYYEGFSRFYSGDGRPFKPLRLNTGGGS